MPKQQKKVRSVPPQVVVRISPDLDASLREAASGLELDLSALVRMIMAEHVHEYVSRARSAAENLRLARGGSKEGTPSGERPEEHVRNLEL